MKTIFITCFHSIISKNILSTDALKVLQEKPELKIVILVPDHKKEVFERYFQHPRVSFEGVDVDILTKYKSIGFLHSIARLLVDSHYLWYKRQERLNQSKGFIGQVKYWAELLAVKLFTRNSIAHSLFRCLDWMVSPHVFDRYFTEYGPDLVFSTDLFDKLDVLLLREAKRRNIKTIGMVRSWDNCYSKGLLRIIPDKILVNNSEIESELLTLHDVEKCQIEIVGLPQFDFFLNKQAMPWGDFAKKMGLNPNYRQILFSPLGAPLSYIDCEVLDILKEAIQKKVLPEDIQFLVRLHPGRELPMGSFIPDNHFIFDKPGVGEGKDVEFRPEDVDHLFDSIYHSKVIIWVATTLGIDALVLDKPQIVANFDGRQKKPYIDSVRRYHDEDHMKKMLDLGGIKVARSLEEMIESLKNYLNDHSLDREERKMIVDQQIQFMDGQSGKRIACSILKELR